jgi:hypothetical protein
MKPIIALLITLISWEVNAQSMDQRKRSVGVPLTMQCAPGKQPGSSRDAKERIIDHSDNLNSRIKLNYICTVRWNGQTKTNFTAQAYWIGYQNSVKHFVWGCTYEMVELIPGKITTIFVSSAECNDKHWLYDYLEMNAFKAELTDVIIRIVPNTDDANRFPFKVYSSDPKLTKAGWMEDPGSHFKFDPGALENKKILNFNK